MQVPTPAPAQSRSKDQVPSRTLISLLCLWCCPFSCPPQEWWPGSGPGRGLFGCHPPRDKPRARPDSMKTSSACGDRPAAGDLI